jgi:hypothetical protein
MKALIPPSLQPFITLSYPVPPSSSHVSHHLLDLHTGLKHIPSHSATTQGHVSSHSHGHAHGHSRNPLHHLLRSDLNSGSTLYDKGIQDIYFVAFWAIAFTLLREGLIRFGFKPFADWWLMSKAAASSKSRAARAKRKGELANGKLNGNGNGTAMAVANGVEKPYKESRAERKRRNHASLRFAEQGWSLTYCTVFWTLGMVSARTYFDQSHP